MATDVVSFDLDSTLCLTDHRRHMLAKGDDYAIKTDWVAYGMACHADADGPALPIAQHLSKMRLPLIIVSGRCHEAHALTKTWLNKRGVFPWGIFLVDWRHNEMSHGEWKAMRLAEIQHKHNWNIVYHYDDLSVVADATAKIGIPTILVHESGKLAENWG